MAPIQEFFARVGHNVSFLRTRSDRGRWQSGVLILGMMLLPAVFAQAQSFTFDTTVQGWTKTMTVLTQPGETTPPPAVGFDSLNWANIGSTAPIGVLQYYTSGFDVPCPAGAAPPCNFWVSHLHSPDLSLDPNWQKAVGYSVRISNNIIGGQVDPLVYANLFVTLLDLDTGTNRNFYDGGQAQQIPYGGFTNFSLQWASTVAASTCTDETGTTRPCPKRFVVKEVFVNIWGQRGKIYNGAVYLDDVIAVTDTAAPSVGITSPTAAPTFNTTANTINLSGTAADNPVGNAYSQIILVSWANSRGGSGNATFGNGAWSANGITLQPGPNILTVTARDAAQNTTSTTLTVTYQDTSITVGTNPAGRSFSIGGQAYSTTTTIPAVSGTPLTIATTSTQSGATGTQYVFANWSDGGTAPTRTITVPLTPTTYTANFTTQYFLTTMPSPSTAGTITANPTSPDGYYNSGTSVLLTATAGANYLFSGFSGDITATTSPQSIVMSAPRSVTANFAPAVTVNVATNPAGRGFTVDGQPYTSSQTFLWAVESSHTIETTSPQTATGARYVFANWSDSGAISHTVMALTDTTITANFTTQYLLTTTASPPAGGSVSANPTSPGGYYDSGTSVQLTANASSLHLFSGFSGDLTGVTNPQSVVMNAPRNVTANFTPPVNVTVNATPSGRSFSVDGQTYTASQTFLWQVQSSHTIATTSPQTATGTRYAFSNWSDTGAISHSITVPATDTTYTAAFAAQAYLLTTAALPTAGGSISVNPPSSDGFYSSGTSVQITATANNGYEFSGFSGDLTGSSSQQSVVMSVPRSVTANFTAYSNISVDTNPTGLSFSVDGTTYSARRVFSWLPGTSHTIATVRAQGSGTSRNAFVNWSDGGAISHTVVAPANAASYVANFDTEYRFVTAVIPADGGQISVSPSSNYYPTNTALQLSAIPAPGYRFVGWSGALSGSANPASMRTSGPHAVTANFAKLAAASLTGMSPTKAAAAGPDFTLAVYGHEFFPDISSINWNGIPLATTFVSSTALSAQVDSSYIAFPGTAKVTVVHSGGATSNALQFTIDQPASPTPVISSISPVTAIVGGPGFDLQVYGSNFLPTSVVRWNGSNRSTIFLSSKQLRATIRHSDISTPGDKMVSVSSPGVASNSVAFTVESPGPVITALNPPAVVTGSSDFTLNVFGMNFVDGATVRWNGSTRPTTYVNSSQLRAEIPASDVSTPGNFSVSVSNGSGGGSGAASFTVITLPPNAPTITGVSPDPIVVGGPAFTLTVFGSGFVPNSVVQWNGQNRPTRFISPTELRADITAADIGKIGVFVILVNNPSSYGEMNEAAAAGSLGLSTVTTPIPFITRITPGSVTAGSADFRITIDGFGFVKDTTYVQWNNRTVLATFQSATQITADVPSADVTREGTMNFSVLNPPPGGGSSDSRTFTMTPKKAPASQLYYPRLMSSATENATENTGIAIANLSGIPASITIRAFGRDGKEISGPQITNPVTMSISGVEQRAITESQVFGSGMPAQKTVGWMRLESSESKVAGFFLVFDNDLQTLDGADVSSSVMKSFVFPELEGSGFNQFHIANPGTAEASVLFELYGSAGGFPKAVVTRTIGPNGALAEYFTDLFPGVTAASGDYLRVVSAEGLVPFAYSGIQGHDAKGLNGQDVTKGSTTLYSPQYAVGGPNWKTTLSVVNLESSPATVTLRFIGDNGEQIGLPQTRIIPGRGKLFVGAQDFFIQATELTQGYVEVRSYEGAQLAGSVVFGDPQQTRYTAALPMISTVQTAMVFGQVASGMIGDKAYFTGLAMLNPTYLDAQVLVELFDRDGRMVTSTSATIPAGRRISQLLTEIFPALTGQDIGSGYIKVTSDRGLASFALFGTLEALSAVPAQIVP